MLLSFDFSGSLWLAPLLLCFLKSNFISQKYLGILLDMAQSQDLAGPVHSHQKYWGEWQSPYAVLWKTPLAAVETGQLLQVNV